MIDSANDDGRPAETDGSANRLSVAEDLVINVGLSAKCYLPEYAPAMRQVCAAFATVFGCNLAAIADVAESAGHAAGMSTARYTPTCGYTNVHTCP